MNHDAEPDLGISTTAIHGRESAGAIGDPVVPAITQSATFYGGASAEDPVLYTRYGNNPDQLRLGAKIAALEGAPAGLVLGSGMAAISMTLLSLARQGDHILASAHLYGATRALLEHELPRRGIETTFVDPFTEGPRVWRERLRDRTRAIYIEGPTNPTLRLLDPRPITELADARGIPVVMDATFATPVNLRPREWGVDVVLHSATKYLGGHSDLIAGAVVGDAPLIDEVVQTSRMYGPAADPHMCFLLDRGISSLDVRMARHNGNARALAERLAAHPRVAAVHHPGLETHPDHALAAELLDGFGGMLAFVVDGGGEAADAVLSRLELARVAPSLGGVETLVSQPRHTSHAALSPEERAGLGIPDGFVRVSVGIEDLDDLASDFSAALDG